MHLNKSINFVLLYLLIDHYLDSPTIGSNDKKKLLKWLQNPQPHEGDSFYESIMNLYLSLATTKKKKNLISKLIKVIKETIKYEKKRGDFYTHLDMCQKKGGWTVYVGSVLIYDRLFEKNDMLMLGSCFQLIDDMMDCRKDQRDGIHTACTIELEERGNLDRMAIVLLKTCEKLPKNLILYREGISVMGIYIVNRSEFYSPMIKGKWYCKTLKFSLSKEIEKNLRSILEFQDFEEINDYKRDRHHDDK